MKQVLATVKSREFIAKEIFKLILQSPAWVGEEVLPGQFAHLRNPKRRDISLRRPISIMDFNPESGEITLIIQTVGEGTRDLSESAPGGELDVIAPIGKGFSLSNDESLIYMVGGGVGVAPLHYTAKCYSKQTIEAFIGFRTSAHIYCENELKSLCKSVTLCTDDGSVGVDGYVHIPLLNRLAEKKPDIIMACGPVPMLMAVQQIAKEHNVPCQLSLEERMGCGVGACLVCNCKIKSGEGFEYRRVCVDGPVFSGDEVMF